MGRTHGELTFQATQLITGHGYFKGYTQRIGKTENGKCSFCGDDREDNQHVLFDCQEWEEERGKMMGKFGARIDSLGAMMRGMTVDPRKWDAVLEFSNRVMDRKERVEREEQADSRRDRLMAETERILRELREIRASGEPAHGED